jgi:hypothetical protein
MAINTAGKLINATEGAVQAFPARRSGSDEPVGAGDSSRDSRMFYSRLIGALFLCGFSRTAGASRWSAPLSAALTFSRRCRHIGPPWSSAPS